MQQNSIRLAKHAGSWYPSQNSNKIKAIIGPHAGYRYSGPVAAWAYKYYQIYPDKKIRIFLLGPSHHKYFQGCSLSNMNQLQTPFGNLQVDKQCIKELKQDFVFIDMSKKQQQKQHSLQMHMPLIKRVFRNNAKVIPFTVGVLTDKLAAEYGKRLAKYFDDQNTIFIISSDFCHWGPHFSYQPYKQGVQIHQHISQLDKQGMNLIESNDTKGFDKYMDDTGNTICGQCPIRILMHTIKCSKDKIETKFVQYDQSDKVKSFNGSSVSYAAAISFLK